MPFVRRVLSATFVKAPGPQGLITGFQEADNANTVTIKDLRMSARIQKAGFPSMDRLSLKIWGMTLSVMKQLSTMGIRFPTLISANIVTLQAGDEGGVPGFVFSGTIFSAWPVFPQDKNAETYFAVESHNGLAQAAIPAPAVSYRGAADIATLISSLANQMGWAFENNGVTGSLSNPNLSGTAWVQLKKLQRAVGFGMTVDEKTLIVWPKGGVRGGAIPLISPDTGMIGYPMFSAYGPTVRTIYNPSLKLGLGSQFRLQSSVLDEGTWQCYSLDHSLDAMLPNGRWESNVAGQKVGAPVPTSKPASPV